MISARLMKSLEQEGFILDFPGYAFNEEKIIENKFVVCPDCSSPVVFSEGCRRCINPTCGWSKCS